MVVLTQPLWSECKIASIQQVDKIKLANWFCHYLTWKYFCKDSVNRFNYHLSIHFCYRIILKTLLGSRLLYCLQKSCFEFFWRNLCVNHPLCTKKIRILYDVSLIMNRNFENRVIYVKFKMNIMKLIIK